jgi:hypothetical protein
MAADSQELHTLEALRVRLREQVNKVPQSIAGSSVQATRLWLKQREAAVKVLNNPRSTATQIVSAIQSIS